LNKLWTDFSCHNPGRVRSLHSTHHVLININISTQGLGSNTAIGCSNLKKSSRKNVEMIFYNSHKQAQNIENSHLQLCVVRGLRGIYTNNENPVAQCRATAIGLVLIGVARHRATLFIFDGL
jgi:hypothetical protein